MIDRVGLKFVLPARVATLTSVMALLFAASANQAAPPVMTGGAEPSSRSALPCNAETATAVELRRLIRQYREFLGKCVAVRGWSFGRALYAEQSASQVEDREVADNLDGSRIGIYRDDEEPVRATDFRPVLMVGTLCDCTALWEDSLMAVGYCHNHLEGPFLSVSEMHRAR